MQELRFVAVSEDGRYAVLAVPGRSARFTLPIDERLRAVALGQTSRLAQYEIEVESPLRPKEIQARIRAGETVEEIADAAGIAVERVRWFEGPVLAERAYMADQAQSASVRRHGDAIPQSQGPRLGEIVAERMKAFGADPDGAKWDAKKLGDGSWQVQLTFISAGRLHAAEWVFDPRRRHVLPADDNAVRMSLPGAEPPQPVAPAPGEATVTRLAPRLSTVAGAGAMGNGGSGNGGPGSGGPGNGGSGSGGLGNGGRSRHERPVPGRPATPEPHGTRPQRPEPRENESPATAAPPVPSAPPASPAPVAAQVSPVQPGRASRPGGPAQPGHVPQPPQPPQPPRPTQAPQPARHARPAQEARIAQAREETATTVTPPGAADSGVAAPPPAEALPPAPAESAGESAARQGRKAARGKRSSVPSWDEIMFGSTRPRD
jgi:hypothetical protein